MTIERTNLVHLCKMLAICTITLLPIGISTIAVGIQNKDDSCQNESPINISQHGWIIIAGVIEIIYVIYIYIISVIGVKYKYNYFKNGSTCDDEVTGSYAANNRAGDMYVLRLSTLWFDIIYAVVIIILVVLGGIIMFNSDNNCVKNGGKSLGIIGLIIWFWFVGILGKCGYTIGDYIQNGNFLPS